MIAGLDGTLEQINIDSVIIKVGGVSFQVFTPSSVLSQLGSGGERVHLYTHLHWKEDATALYGFTTVHELDLFKMLISVSGVGPKSALSILSTLKSDELASAILGGDADLIAQAPGIGKKTAARIILDLKGRIEKGWGGSIAAGPARDNSEVVSALTSLGYSTADATRAAAAVPTSGDMTLEDRIRLALRHVART